LNAFKLPPARCIPQFNAPTKLRSVFGGKLPTENAP
jgi:hypothetical protein